MTPDHTPYLRPGVDLVTAEDVLAWQADCVLAWVPEHPGERMPAGTLVGLLRARLDRERRQACRRGALDRWRMFRSWVHGWGYDPMQEGGEEAAECLSDALAFRAAARAK